MASSNRSALINKTYKILKKHYKPMPMRQCQVLESLLFACCLENAHYDKAEEAYAALASGFFDWNEVRVSSVDELAEVMKMLPDPASSANNLKRVLYSVFESTYSFEIEALRKQNLGQAIQRLEKYEGTTPFIVAYATQTTLGGHSIPLDRGALEALAIIGLATADEVAKAAVSGLERAIPKNKGVEFGSLLHQLGADLVANPLSPALHKILLEIAPDAKDRLPKRQPKAPPKPEPAPKAEAKEAAKPADAKKKGAPAPPPKAAPSKAAPPKAAPPVKAAAAPAKKAEDEKKHEAAKKPVKKEAPKSKATAVSLKKRKPR
jgi:endonuclease-3